MKLSLLILALTVLPVGTLGESQLRGDSRAVLSDDVDAQLMQSEEAPYADNSRSMLLLSSKGTSPDAASHLPSYDYPGAPGAGAAGAGAGLIGLIYLVTWLCTLCFVCCSPFIYYFGVNKERPVGQLGRNVQAGQEGADFQTPKFGCLEDPEYCVVGWCFNLCRMADTVSIIGNNEGWMSYWGVLGLYVLGLIVASFTAGVGLLAIWAVNTFLMTKLRAQLRQSMGRRADVDGEDLLFWCCCPLCAICQEAREADKATGTRVKCGPCPSLVLEPRPADMVGLPVAAPPLVAGPGGAPPPQVSVEVVGPQVVQASAPQAFQES